MIVWRVEDWSQVARIVSPFSMMISSTFALRCSWSPDGQWLLAGNSFQGATHAAVLVPRERWTRPKDYLLISGHSGATMGDAGGGSVEDEVAARVRGVNPGAAGGPHPRVALTDPLIPVARLPPTRRCGVRGLQPPPVQHPQPGQQSQRQGERGRKRRGRRRQRRGRGRRRCGARHQGGAGRR